MTKLHQVRAEIDAQAGKALTTAQEEIGKFADEISDNPAHAFAWADAPIFAAGLIAEWRDFLRWADRNVNTELAAVAEYYTGRLLEAIAYPGGSTSPSSRLTDAGRLRAKAKICMFLKELAAKHHG